MGGRDWNTLVCLCTGPAWRFFGLLFWEYGVVDGKDTLGRVGGWYPRIRIGSRQRHGSAPYMPPLGLEAWVSWRLLYVDCSISMFVVVSSSEIGGECIGRFVYLYHEMPSIRVQVSLSLGLPRHQACREGKEPKSSLLARGTCPGWRSPTKQPTRANRNPLHATQNLANETSDMQS